VLKKTAGLIGFVVPLIAAACSEEQTLGDQTGSIDLQLSINEIMTGVITPATNAIWEGSYLDTLSDEDWQLLLQSSIQVYLSAEAISFAQMNDVDNGRLDMSDWQEWSRQLAELALVAKDAAENRDQMAFADAGDAMVEICEACHTAYLTGAQ